MRWLLVVALAGCGPGGSWSGTWSGLLHFSGTCSDGSSDDSAADIEWKIASSQTELYIQTGSACGQLEATRSGDVAHLRDKTCEPVSENGSTTTISFKKGTMWLRGQSTDLEVSIPMVITGAISASCDFAGKSHMTRTSTDYL